MRFFRLIVPMLCASLWTGLWPVPAPAQSMQAAASPAVLAFDRFVRTSAPLCERRAARLCVDAGWDFADANGDGLLALAELAELRQTMGAWMDWRGDSLSKRERASIALGLWLVDSVGLERLLASYSLDGDHQLSREELLADVTLDERPLGEVLLDAEAVDRKAVAQRLGSLSPMLEGLLKSPP